MQFKYSDYTTNDISLNINFIQHGIYGLDKHCSNIYNYIENNISMDNWSLLENNLITNKQNKTLKNSKEIARPNINPSKTYNANIAKKT